MIAVVVISVLHGKTRSEVSRPEARNQGLPQTCEPASVTVSSPGGSDDDVGLS
jgi:hypothetical protein